MKLNKNQLSVVKSIIKEEIEKFQKKVLTEGKKKKLMKELEMLNENDGSKRLSKVAMELNMSIDSVAKELTRLTGLEMEPNPNLKISPEFYELLTQKPNFEEIGEISIENGFVNFLPLGNYGKRMSLTSRADIVGLLNGEGGKKGDVEFESYYDNFGKHGIDGKKKFVQYITDALKSAGFKLSDIGDFEQAQELYKLFAPQKKRFEDNLWNEEIEKFKSLKEGSWQVITNDEGEPIGKDYVYGPEDPEYYETGDDYNDDRPRSRVGSSVGEKSDVINSIRDILKRNDIYSKIVMSSGRSGRYISIPYNNSNLAIRFVFKRGEGMKIEVGSRLFTDVYEAVDYLIKNSDKNMFKSQSEHESSLKAGAKDKRAQNVKDKEAKKAEQEKLEKLEKIKRIPAIASAIGEHGLYNKRDFKILFGNTPSKVISSTIQDIIETMPYDELRKIVKITVDTPKYFSENKKTKKKQITISELKQIIKESIESLDDKAISEGGKDGIEEGDYILVHQDPYEVVSGMYMDRVPDGNPDDGFSPEWYYKIKDADGEIWKMKTGQLRKGLKKYLSKEEFESISAERKEEKIRRSAQLDAELKAQSQARIDAERKAQIDAGNKYKSLPLVPNDIKEEFYFEFEENVYDFGIEDLGRDDLVMEVFSSSFETENDYVQLKAVVTLDTELGHDTSFDRNTGKFNWLEIGYSNEKIVKLTFVDANTGEDKYRLDDELTKMVEGDIYECLDYLEEDFREQAKGWSASY